MAAEECVCGSAGLWWPQRVEAQTRLWDMAAEATANLRRLRSEKAGQNWLHFLSTEFWAPPVTVRCCALMQMKLLLAQLCKDRVCMHECRLKTSGKAGRQRSVTFGGWRSCTGLSCGFAQET